MGRVDRLDLFVVRFRRVRHLRVERLGLLAVFAGLRFVGYGTPWEVSVLRRLVLFQPAGQLVLAVMAAMALFVALERRDSYGAGSGA